MNQDGDTVCGKLVVNSSRLEKFVVCFDFREGWFRAQFKRRWNSHKYEKTKQ